MSDHQSHNSNPPIVAGSGYHSHGVIHQQFGSQAPVHQQDHGSHQMNYNQYPQHHDVHQKMHMYSENQMHEDQVRPQSSTNYDERTNSQTHRQFQEADQYSNNNQAQYAAHQQMQYHQQVPNPNQFNGQPINLQKQGSTGVPSIPSQGQSYPQQNHHVPSQGAAHTQEPLHHQPPINQPNYPPQQQQYSSNNYPHQMNNQYNGQQQPHQPPQQQQMYGQKQPYPNYPPNTAQPNPQVYSQQPPQPINQSHPNYHQNQPNANLAPYHQPDQMVNQQFPQQQQNYQQMQHSNQPSNKAPAHQQPHHTNPNVNSQYQPQRTPDFQEQQKPPHFNQQLPYNQSQANVGQQQNPPFNPQQPIQGPLNQQSQQFPVQQSQQNTPNFTNQQQPNQQFVNQPPTQFPQQLPQSNQQHLIPPSQLNPNQYGGYPQQQQPPANQSAPSAIQQQPPSGQSQIQGATQQHNGFNGQVAQPTNFQSSGLGSSTQLSNLMNSRQEESKVVSRGESSQNLNGLQEHTFNNDNRTNGDQSQPKNEKYVGFVSANIYQAATLNKLLPRGFKIEQEEIVQRSIQQRLAQLLQQQKNAAAAQKKKKPLPPQIQTPAYQPIQKQSSKTAESLHSIPTEYVNTQTPALPSVQDSDDGLNANKSGQRISAREKRPVNYNSMAAGTGEISASMDYGEVSGQNQRSQQKKPANLNNPKEVKQKCDQLFQTLKCHPSISLFLIPLDPNHPKFAEIQPEFINLHKIELNFQQGKYLSTFQLGNDFRKMWQVGYKLYAEDPEKINKIQTLQNYFESIFQEYENKPLPTQQQTHFGHGMDQHHAQPHPSIQTAPKSNQQMNKKLEKIQKELQQMNNKPNQPALPPQSQTKNQRTMNQIQNTIQHAQQSNVSDKPMTPQEKAVLKDYIVQLTPEQQRGIIEIVQDTVTPSNSDVFEFELDSLPNRKCRELDIYVKKCISLNQKKQKRKEADALRRQQQKAQKNAQPQNVMQMPQSNLATGQMQQQYGIPGQVVYQQIPGQQPIQQLPGGLQQTSSMQGGQVIPNQVGGQLITPMGQNQMVGGGMAQPQVMMGGQMVHQQVAQHQLQPGQMVGQGQPGYGMLNQGGQVGMTPGVQTSVPNQSNIPLQQTQQAPVNQNFSYGRRENLNEDSESDSESDDSDSDDDSNIKKPTNLAASKNSISEIWKRQQMGN